MSHVDDRFPGDGACVDITQALNAKAKAAACASSRSCVKAHPAKLPSAVLICHLHASLFWTLVLPVKQGRNS